MAKITITIDPADEARVFDAIASRAGHRNEDGTKAEFAKVIILRFIENLVADHDRSEAVRAAEVAETAKGKVKLS